MFPYLRRFIKPKRIYLDFAATTPVRAEVMAAMRPYFAAQFGNPSSVHAEGVAAARALEAAREEMARNLRVRATDVTFTGGGTESNNLAILGHVRWLREEMKLNPDDIAIISTPVEHPSISEVLHQLQKEGIMVHEVPVDESGRVALSDFKALLSPKTRLVTMHYANSETGVIQDVGKLTRMVRAFAEEHETKILFHIDAAQAPLWLPCDPERLGVDLLSLDAGKCYGPKGVGVLVHRPRTQLLPVTLGGSQERGLRPGTENTPLIVGCARALTIAQESYEKRSTAVAALRDHLIKRLTSEIDGCVLNGTPEHRLSNNVNISIPGIDSEFAVVKLDSEGIAASTKSACSGADGGGSSVVAAMTGDAARASSTIRFSLGEETTRRDLDRAVEALKAHAASMKRFQNL